MFQWLSVSSHRSFWAVFPVDMSHVTHTVDGSAIRRENQLRLVGNESTIIYPGFSTSQTVVVCRISEASTVFWGPESPFPSCQ